MDHKYQAKIEVTLKKSVLDPQGQTGLQALSALGFNNANDLRVGKYYVIAVTSSTLAIARSTIEDMCNKLLVNPVIEEFNITDITKIGDLGGTANINP